jgi:hypothetical protein
MTAAYQKMQMEIIKLRIYLHLMLLHSHSPKTLFGTLHPTEKKTRLRNRCHFYRKHRDYLHPKPSMLHSKHPDLFGTRQIQFIHWQRTFSSVPSKSAGIKVPAVIWLAIPATQVPYDQIITYTSIPTNSSL